MKKSVLRSIALGLGVATAGMFSCASHYAGDSAAGIKPFRWTGTNWIYKFLDDYEKVYPNL